MNMKNKRNENWMKQHGGMSWDRNSQKVSGKYQKGCMTAKKINLPRQSRRGA